MQLYLWGLPVVGSWAALVVAVSAAPAAPQGAEKPPPPRPVDIVTVDHVELKGKFYPCALGKTAPCVMLLHALGETESSNNKEWTTLARALQKKCAVLTFDFRGHGDSKTVRPGTYNANKQLAVNGFWDEVYNQKYVRGLVAKKPRPTEIHFKDFLPEYYTCLCNDIAAARAFLDERNDAGECNSANLIIMGAKDGASLGALWLNSECQRYRFLPDGMGGSIDKENPEGKCVTAAVWLSVAGKFAKSKQVFSVSRLLEIAAKRDKIPVLWLYGEGDEPGKKLALDCEKYIRGKNDKDYPFTAAMKVKDAEGAVGRELLLGSLDTTKQIIEFLEGALPKKPAPHKMRAKDDQMYLWVWTDNSGRQYDAPAKGKGKSLVVYSGYGNFLR
jgi:hypothetical protein